MRSHAGRPVMDPIGPDDSHSTFLRKILRHMKAVDEWKAGVIAMYESMGIEPPHLEGSRPSWLDDEEFPID